MGTEDRGNTEKPSYSRYALWHAGDHAATAKQLRPSPDLLDVSSKFLPGIGACWPRTIMLENAFKCYSSVSHGLQAVGSTWARWDGRHFRGKFFTKQRPGSQREETVKQTPLEVRHGALTVRLRAALAEYANESGHNGKTMSCGWSFIPGVLLRVHNQSFLAAMMTEQHDVIRNLRIILASMK